MDAIVYVRWSTKDQSKGDSEARQMSLAIRAAEGRWKIVETLIETGKSAYHGRNRALGGKLREIEDRAARGELAGKVLIVEAMDRLSRQEPLESVTLLSTLAKQGLTICESSTGTIYDASSISDHWAHLLIAFARAGEAHDSSRIKSQRITSAWRATQEQLQTRDGKADPRLCPSWIEVVDGAYRVVETRAAVIRRMFDMAATGHGLRPIAAMANEDRASSGWPAAEWHIRSVTNLLHGRRVLGEYTPQMRTEDGKRATVGEPVALYPPIVTLNQWARAQAGLKQRASSGGPRGKAINLLSQLCRCTYRNEGENQPCGARLSYRGQKRGPNQLTCSRFARGGGCRCNSNYRYDDLLNGILDNVLTIALPDPVEHKSQTATIAVAKAELAAKQARLDEIADEIIMSGDPVKERAYQRFKARVEEDAAALKAMMGEAEEIAGQLPPAELARRALALREQLSTSLDARLEVQSHLNQLIDAIFMDPDDRSATVVMLGGLLNIKLDKYGALIGTATQAVLDEQAIAATVGDDPVRNLTFERWRSRG